MRAVVVASMVVVLAAGGVTAASAQGLRFAGPPPAGSPQSAPERKIAGPLRGLIAAHRSELRAGRPVGADFAARHTSPLLKVDDAGRVQVYVHVADTRGETLDGLRLQGLDVEVVNDRFGIVRGWIAIDRLEPLAGEPAVVRITPPSYATTRVGSVTSQGDAIHRCDLVRGSVPSATGAGVKVGVISDGIDGLAASQGSGDLAAVQVPFGAAAGSGDEGTAMLEIVHDCAPDAQLAFASGFPDALGFIGAVNALKAWGAQIIVDDLGFYSEPFFEDGPVALNDRTVGATVLRVSAAGNDRQRHYQGSFAVGPFDSQAQGFRHVFGGGDTLLRFRVGAGQTATIVLQWADRFGQAGDNYDFCVREPDGLLVGCALGVQDGNEDPIEVGFVTCTGGSTCFGDLQVTLFRGSSRLLKLFCLGSCAFDEFAVAGGSIVGHPAVPEVLAVAAANASTSGTIEFFSSAGPVTIVFPSAVTRSKPDVMGVDCVATSRPGFTTFCGTSAAAPHVAGLAALIRQAKPVAAPELREIVKLAAVDAGAAGFDSSFGFGRADAFNGVLLFVDVHSDNIYRPWVEALYKASVTGGCAAAPLRYCPDQAVTRGQMAVFLLRSHEPFPYTPPACGSPRFGDVPCSHPFADWINELAARGVTAGCGGGNYCPDSSVTRQEMAVFLLRTKGVTPAACAVATFTDVPCSSPFADWIEQLVADGVTGGCAVSPTRRYCPTDPVTRSQMAVFLVRTFNLPFP